MGKLSTHVLDTLHGKPASGVAAATAASDVKPPVAAAASGADSLDPAAISKGISGLK